MFRIKEKLGGCCNSCSKTLNDNEKCITITTYWIDPLKYEHGIMRMSLCENCYKMLKLELNKKTGENMKRISDLTDDELLSYLEKKDLKCQYCEYNNDCKGIICYGGEPIFPICVDFPEGVIDTILSNAKEDKDLMNKEVE